MIRVGLLYLVVVVLMIVAPRRWYASLCGLLFLTVLTQHPDTPARVFGVPGLNPWNALLFVFVGCWLFTRRSAHTMGTMTRPQPTRWVRLA